MLTAVGGAPTSRATASSRSLSFEEQRRATKTEVQSAEGPKTFREFVDLGYGPRLVPIIPPGAEISPKSSFFKSVGALKDSRGKAPGAKGHDGLWRGLANWQNHETTEEDLRQWQADAAGVGIRCGNGLVAIDSDTLDPALARVVDELVINYFICPPVRYGRRPKALYLIRVTDPVRYSRIDFDGINGRERLELLSDGKQFVAGGVHKVTGAPYEWPNGLTHFDKLPTCSPDHINEFFEALRKRLPNASALVSEGAASSAVVDQASLRGDLEKVRKAVALIPNSGDAFASRDAYIHIGHAVKAALPDHPDEAFDIYSGWCSRWAEGENDPETVEADWNRMQTPFRRGANWLYELAEQHAPDKFSRAEAWFDPIAGENSPFGTPKSDTAETKTFELVTLQHAAETALQHSHRPLVKGLLDQGTLSVCYGESNVGKTFVAMDIAFAIAAGLPWGNMRTTKMAVLYIAAEGGPGARKRSGALVRKYGSAAKGAVFYLHLSSVNLLRADADLRTLIQTIRQLKESVGLVVVDTLSRAMAGGDENASTDMGALVKHLDAIRAATGAHVMAVHHSGKDKAKGARGHSLLRAATDTEIEISEGQIMVTKQRDLDKAYGAGFALDVHKLGNDADGDPVTSCTVRLVPKHEARGVPTPAEERVLCAVDDTTPPGSGKGVTVAEVLPVARTAGLKTDEEGVRTHLRNLERKSLVRRIGRGKWARMSGPAVSTEYFQPVDDKIDGVVSSEQTGRESGSNVFE